MFGLGGVVLFLPRTVGAAPAVPRPGRYVERETVRRRRGSGRTPTFGYRVIEFVFVLFFAIAGAHCKFRHK